MKNFKPFHSFLPLLLLLAVLSVDAPAQQAPDTVFRFNNPHPAYSFSHGPIVLIDQAHHNFHTQGGGFFAFSKLLEQDGYRVSPLTEPVVSLDNLKDCRILVIANALDISNVDRWILPTPPAFTGEEIVVIEQWVRNGGCLLLIADHMPFAGAASQLGKAFGFEFLNGFAFTAERSWPPSSFTRVDSSLRESPITYGDKVSEPVEKVVSFTGSAFKSPTTAIPVLSFKPEHWSIQPDTAWNFKPGIPRQSLDGFQQGALLNYGKGKVAVFGEAAMFTAQIVNGQFPVGFNSPDAPQNALFTLKLLHWLDGMEELQEELDAMIRNQGVPGVTLALRFHDGTLLSLASGLADMETQIPMPSGALMFSGSVGKTFVAAVVLKLVEQGKLRLNEKASDYLGNEAWFRNIPNAGEITLAMLLNHTAGVPEYVYHKELWQEVHKDPDKTWSVEERMDFIKNDPSSNAPGAGWAYSDSHYILLGAIIEKATAKRYEDVLNEMILVPCKLSQTFPACSRNLPGLIPGYTELTEEMLLPHKVVNEGQYAFNPQLEWTGGGLITNVSDLASWARQLYGGKMLSTEMRNRMLTPSLLPTTLPANAMYGLGCIIGETNGLDWYGHTGFVPGYITIMEYIPALDLSMAMQVNTDSLHGEVAKEVYDNIKKKIQNSVYYQ